MSQAWPLMQAAFDARLQADLIPVLRGKIQVHVSKANDSAGMLGAALLAV
jgi:glucokinase